MSMDSQESTYKRKNTKFNVMLQNIPPTNKPWCGITIALVLICAVTLLYVKASRQDDTVAGKRDSDCKTDGAYIRKTHAAPTTAVTSAMTTAVTSLAAMTTTPTVTPPPAMTPPPSAVTTLTLPSDMTAPSAVPRTLTTRINSPAAPANIQLWTKRMWN
nr:uncharacterized protein LOC128706457 [Cherax quadricarinatus]